MVVGGRVLEGLHGIAGEWGHNPMRGERTPCYCGRAGCVETVISGPALERHYRERTGRSVRLPEIVSAPPPASGPRRRRFGASRSKFGEAIAAVINILDPDAVVIGGGVGNIDLLYDERDAPRGPQARLQPELRTEFLRPLLGDSAGVFGAAMLSASSRSEAKRAGSPRAPPSRSG